MLYKATVEQDVKNLKREEGGGGESGKRQEEERKADSYWGKADKYNSNYNIHQTAKRKIAQREHCTYKKSKLSKSTKSRT